MAIDRNRLEQEALRLLQRGQNERALERYLTLLRDKPRDLRVRQQVADLYLKVGQKGKAEQHLREIARFHKNSGKARAAIGVYKQILRIKPDDTALYGDLGECYQAAGFPKEALQSFERVVGTLSKYNPDKAVPYQERLIALQPGKLPVQVKLAELYEQANWAEKAQNEWRRLAREARRHGKLDDRARFLMKSLAVRESEEITLEAAEAWVDIGEFDSALPLLQRATSTRPEDPVALTLLARTLTGLGARDKAAQVWMLVARLHLAAGRAPERAEALAAALDAGATDPTLQAQVDRARALADRVAMRLTDCDWAQPADTSAGDAVVRAGVYATYGLADKARELLDQTLEASDDIAVRVALAEVRATLEDIEGAIEMLDAIQAPSAAAREAIRTRTLVLQGRPEDADAPEAPPDELFDDELLDDDLLDDELLDDEATDPGPVDAAPAAEDPAELGPLDDDLLDDELLDDELLDDEPTGEVPAPQPMVAPEPPTDDDGLASLFGGALDGETEEPEPAEDDGLASLFGDSLGAAPSFTAPAVEAPAAPPVAPAVGGSAFPDASALLQVCAWDRVDALLAGGTSLAHELMRSQTERARGDLGSALTRLRAAVGDAAENDPAYLPALVESAELHAGTGKLRAARRLLDEVEDIDPSHQTARVQLIRRGLALLRG